MNRQIEKYMKSTNEGGGGFDVRVTVSIDPRIADGLTPRPTVSSWPSRALYSPI